MELEAAADTKPAKGRRHNRELQEEDGEIYEPMKARKKWTDFIR